MNTNTWVGLLIIKDHKVLLVRNKKQSLFSLPGCKLKAKDTAESALLREIQNTTSCKVKSPELFTICKIPENEGTGYITTHIFTATLVGKPKPGKGIEEIIWLDSAYEKQNKRVDNLLKQQIIPDLVSQKLIH